MPGKRDDFLQNRRLDDPVLRSVGARNVMLAGASLSGVFTECEDPGHLVGKGWMELDFGELIPPNAQIIPLTAKVVGVQGYQVDPRGRIRGKAHAVRDTIEWFVPPGPRPKLKPETLITVKVMRNTAVDLAEDQPRVQQVYRSSAGPRDRYGFRGQVEPASYEIAHARHFRNCGDGGGLFTGLRRGARSKLIQTLSSVHPNYSRFPRYILSWWVIYIALFSSRRTT